MQIQKIKVVTIAGWILSAWMLCGGTACSLQDLVGDSQVPIDTSDPTVAASLQGALGLYVVAQHNLAKAVSEFTVKSGLLSDELRPMTYRNSPPYTNVEHTIDARHLLGVNQTPLLREFQNAGDFLYASLHKVRGSAQQARGALVAYAPQTHRNLIGHLYAIEGFADVLLADLYCSGIPLSTIDFGEDFTIQPGSRTGEIYQHAVGLFDSAITFSGDSIRFREFARIGKARALLALGDYSAVSAIVSNISVEYKYEAYYSEVEELRNAFKDTVSVSVSDGEGSDNSVGIKYGSLNDPRASVRSARSSSLRPYIGYLPMKYSSEGVTPIVLASGIEAQLILAEVQLQTSSTSDIWLRTLNVLRTTCIDTDMCSDPAPAGSGGIAGLPLETNPATSNERVLLLFRERALWLFLTGHRQGDMRRLMRNYGIPETALYATGAYYLNTVAGGHYGASLNFPVSEDETLSNPLYRGCYDRNA